MQQGRNKTMDHIIRGSVGITWVAGLIIAGSDNAYMPWVNGVGLFLFLGASIFMGKYLKASSKETGTFIHARFSKNEAPCHARQFKRLNKRYHSRYALSA